MRVTMHRIRRIERGTAGAAIGCLAQGGPFALRDIPMANRAGLPDSRLPACASRRSLEHGTKPGVGRAQAQHPDGLTRHRLSVRRGARCEQVHEFAGETQAGDWLIFTSSIPLDGVSGLRVDTVLSPSWVAWSEIEVFGEAAP